MIYVIIDSSQFEPTCQILFYVYKRHSLTISFDRSVLLQQKNLLMDSMDTNPDPVCVDL